MSSVQEMIDRSKDTGTPTGRVPKFKFFPDLNIILEEGGESARIVQDPIFEIPKPQVIVKTPDGLQETSTP